MAVACPPVIDIGLNLTHKSFQSDLPQVVDRAIAVGVAQMILTGTTLAGSEEACSLAERFPGRMYSTAGIHPHHASEFNAETLAELKALAAKKTVVAIGECGLDFFRNYSPQDEQRSCFREQLELAKELGLPVFLHERDAHEAFAEILEPAVASLQGAVVHCFTGNPASLHQYLEMGCFIGVTGWVCDERRGGELRELVPEIPLDRLMIETDAPYLSPRDLRPKPKSTRNEPCHLPHIGKVIAELRGIDYTTLARSTTENARRFFGLNEKDGTLL